MRTLLGGAALAGILLLGGCSIGKSATGSAVLGVPIGIHPDANAAQTVGAAVGSIFGPHWGLVGGGVGTVLATAFGWRARNAVRESKAERSDRLRAEREAAEQRGRHEGWDERERDQWLRERMATDRAGGVVYGRGDPDLLVGDEVWTRVEEAEESGASPEGPVEDDGHYFGLAHLRKG